jgi:protein ImuA
MQRDDARHEAGPVGRATDLIREAAAIAPAMSTGVAEIDAALPWGGLPRGVHEIAAPSGDAAGTGFASVLLRGRAGPILWCRSRRVAAESGAPYGLGLAEFGLSPEQLILVEADRPAELFWAMEEGLRARRHASVVGEGATPDLTASRRLQLAAEAGEGVALLLTAAASASPLSESMGAKGSSLAAMTRWLAVSAPSEPEAGGPGRPRWRLELRRCRGGGRPQSWMVEWEDAALSLSLVPALADRPLAAAAG